MLKTSDSGWATCSDTTACEMFPQKQHFTSLHPAENERKQGKGTKGDEAGGLHHSRHSWDSSMAWLFSWVEWISEGLCCPISGESLQHTIQERILKDITYWLPLETQLEFFTKENCKDRKVLLRVFLAQCYQPPQECTVKYWYIVIKLSCQFRIS